MHSLLTPCKSILLFCLLLFFSCRKDPAGSATGKPAPSDNASRPVGQPIDDVYTEFIGPEGGTVQSPDGEMEVVIPPGALATTTEIGIQPITHTAISGIGNGYRLTPHGAIFQKKVTVRFRYEGKGGRISNTTALEVAYQNQEGVWTCIGGAKKDPVRKTISVETDHFSDWGFIASMQLLPVVSTIGVGESKTLKAFYYIQYNDEDDFLVSLTNPEAGTGTPILIQKKYVVGWTLHGPGKLQANGAEAVYTAPVVMPEETSVTITLELNVNGKQVLLVSTLHIIKEGIMISLDGGPWKLYGGMATKVSEMGVFSLGSLRISPDIPQIVLMWPARSATANGIYHWNMQGSDKSMVVFEYATPNLAKTYVAGYDDANHNWRNSSGFLSVEEETRDGKKYLTGMFAVDKAAVMDTQTGEQTRIGSVAGTFCVLRNW